MQMTLLMFHLSALEKSKSRRKLALMCSWSLRDVFKVKAELITNLLSFVWGSFWLSRLSPTQLCCTLQRSSWSSEHISWQKNKHEERLPSLGRSEKNKSNSYVCWVLLTFTVPFILHSIWLISTITLWSKNYFCPHFVVEELRHWMVKNSPKGTS